MALTKQYRDKGKRRTTIKTVYGEVEYRRVEKTMPTGMEKSTQFHEKREACIRKKYNVDEIGQRILNGDGGSWIKEPYDPSRL